jgi:putative endonuclease
LGSFFFLIYFTKFVLYIFVEMDRGGKLDRGKMAEDFALDYLTGLGQVLMERNWRCGHKELDLIMSSVSQGGVRKLHIVEVRSLMDPAHCLPYESINYKKQKMVMSAARSYIYQNNINWETQFDIVSVIIKREGLFLEYFPGAFEPTWR